MKKKLLIFCILLSCIAFNNVTAQINYQWVKGIHSGSQGLDFGKSTVVDDAGNVYVTGQFELSLNESAEFNPFGTPSKPLFNKGRSCFVAKYGADGNCEWAGSVGTITTNSGFAGGTCIAVDASHNVYVLGVFQGIVDFDPSSTSIHQLTSLTGGQDCFFAMYNSAGEFQWVKAFGGSGEEWGMGITVDGTGGIYVTGFFNSQDAYFYGEGESPAHQQSNPAGGQNNIFIAKYDNSGAWQWANSIGDTGDDRALDIAIGGNDYYWVTITGYFQDTVDFGEGTTRFATGSKDAYFAKYATGDGSLGYPFHILGQNGSVASGTCVTMDNNSIYIGGVFKDTISFTDTLDGPVLKSLGSIGIQDVFFTKYEISHELDFANSIKCGSATDSAFVSDIAIDPLGFTYLTGAFEGSAQFNPSGGDILNSAGNLDIFFAKYGDSLVGEVWAKRMGSIKDDVGYSIAVDNSENIYLTGGFRDTVNFDPGEGIANRSCYDDYYPGLSDIFIAKYGQGTSTISGNVTIGIYDVNVGHVYLYTQIFGDGNSAMHLVDSTSLQTGGYYEFSDVNTGDYIVLALANPVDFPNAIPTYYANYGGNIHWQNATIVTTSPNTTSQADIALQVYDENFLGGGNATLSGKVLEGDGYDRTAGTPIIGVPIGLEHDPEGIVGTTTTNSAGYYVFNGVPLGNYRLYVDIPGLPMDSTYNVSITVQDTSVIDLNFVADSSAIDTVPKTTTSVIQIVSSQTNLEIYPNPYKVGTTIEFTLPKTNHVQIEVCNLLGEKLAELLNEQKQAGIVKCRFIASDKGLKAGIYLLNLKVGDETITKKIIQIE